MFELSTFPQIISLPPIPPHVYNNNSINLITNLKAGRQGHAAREQMLDKQMLPRNPLPYHHLADLLRLPVFRWVKPK